MGNPYGTDVGFATGIHMGPIWAHPYGPIRAPYSASAGHSLYLPGGISPQYGRHIHVCHRPGLERTTARLDARRFNH